MLEAGAARAFVEQVEGTFGQVILGEAKVAAEEALEPGAAVAAIGDKREANLRDGDGQGVVTAAGAIAGGLADRGSRSPHVSQKGRPAPLT